MIFRAWTQGPSGRSASLYQTSPSMVAPIASDAIITYFLRYTFQLHEQLLSRIGLPPSASCRRKGDSSRVILPAAIRSCWSLGFRGGVSFFQAQISRPEASRSSWGASLRGPPYRVPGLRQVYAS